MAALPQSNTKRYFVTWGTPLGPHTTTIRATAATTDADALANIHADYVLLAPGLATNVTLDALAVAAINSDVRNPVAGWTQIVGTGGTTLTGQFQARSFSARFRSTLGHKGKILTWGLVVAAQADFELAPASFPASVAAWLASIISRANYYIAIDGTKPVFHPNLLEDYNDHWVKALRP